MLAESDSLFLTPNQMAAVRRADSVFPSRVRALYIPLGLYLPQFADGVATKAALDSVNATQKSHWTIFWEQPEVADSLINATQRELIPMLKSMLATPKKEREHSQWIFGYPIRFRDDPKELRPVR